MAQSREMCPLGLIVVLDKSVEEWIVHPDGCEIVEIRFHYEMLRTYLELRTYESSTHYVPEG